MGEGDGDGGVLDCAADEEVDVLHFEHGLGGVGEGGVEGIGAGEATNVNVWWSGHNERVVEDPGFGYLIV